MTTPHAAIVLAAGGSTRLGRPKQLLRREGEALVARAVRLVGDTGPSRLVVMLGASRDAVAAELHAAPGAELHDVAAWRTGLSASLRAAAHVLLGHSGPVLITGVDADSDAAEKRLAAGDVVVEVAQEPVGSAADIKKRIEQIKKDGKKSALLLVSNGAGELRFVPVSVQ